MVIPFDIFESAHAVNVKGIQSIAITGGQVPCIRAIQQSKGDQYISNLVCREMKWRFHSALPIREVISASMEPSAKMISASMEPSANMIEPSYVNEDTNSTSSMLIGVVIAEKGIPSWLWSYVC